MPTTATQLTGLAPDGNVNQRYQSDDGTTVAFETSQALLPNDLNGDVTDVYLWRRDKPLTLISAGRSDAISNFDGMSADGHSVFFEASDRLVSGVDQDNKKLYVARLGGGFPPSETIPRCAEDACQGLLTQRPPFTTPASETLPGPPKGSKNAGKAVVRLAGGGINGAQRRRLSKSGVLPLTLVASAGGKLAVAMSARLAGGWISTDRANRTLKHAGKVRLTLHLNHRARSYLAAKHSLRIRITARVGGSTTKTNILLHQGG